MSALLLTLLGAFLVLWVLLAARWLNGISWRRSLVAFRLRIPGTVTTAEVARWLARVQVMTESPQWYVVPNAPVALEICAERGQITNVLLVPEWLRATVLASLHAALPTVRVDALPDYLDQRPRCKVAAEGVLTHHGRPLAVERAAETSQHMLASLQPLHGTERLYVQWIFSGVSRKQPRRIAKGEAVPWWLDSDALADAEDVRAQRLKYKAPLCMASLRVGVQAGRQDRTLRLFHRVWLTLGGMDGPGVRLLKRWYVSMPAAGARLADLRLPIFWWPVLLNVEEAAGLSGLAAEGRHLPGMPVGIARTLPAPSSMARRGLVLAESNYPGDARPLALLRSDRLRHVWVMGPTGSGKSTLLQNLVYQDMWAGDGLIVIDGRGDLIYDLLDRVPAHRLDDVFVMDAAHTTGRIVGYNPLALGQNERGRELAVEHMLSVLRSVYQASWGIRTADVMRAGLLTLVHGRATDGSRLTLMELPELLVNDQFRSFMLRQPMAPALRSFWAWYNNLSIPERSVIISPVLNKLRAWVLSTPIRRTLGQSEGINLADAFTKRKIIFVPLKKGVLGAESSALIGSLVMAGVWNATLSRADIPPEKRRPTWLYADEFQEIMRLPLDLADMLAQARGLGLGITLAHQILGQLTPELKAAVLGTTRSQAVFQVEYDDARALAPRFAPLTADDLGGLGSHEIAFRACVRGSTLAPVTGATYPPVEPLGSRAEVVARSLTAHAADAADIEAALLKRIATGSGERSNRRTKGGQA